MEEKGGGNQLSLHITLIHPLIHSFIHLHTEQMGCVNAEAGPTLSCAHPLVKDQIYLPILPSSVSYLPQTNAHRPSEDPPGLVPLLSSLLYRARPFSLFPSFLPPLSLSTATTNWERVASLLFPTGPTHAGRTSNRMSVCTRQEFRERTHAYTRTHAPTRTKKTMNSTHNHEMSFHDMRRT